MGRWGVKLGGRLRISLKSHSSISNSNELIFFILRVFLPFAEVLSGEAEDHAARENLDNTPKEVNECAKEMSLTIAV